MSEVLLVGQKFGVNHRVMNDILNASTGQNLKCNRVSFQ
jgi:hypothetical protein